MRRGLTVVGCQRGPLRRERGERFTIHKQSINKVAFIYLCILFFYLVCNWNLTFPPALMMHLEKYSHKRASKMTVKALGCEYRRIVSDMAISFEQIMGADIWWVGALWLSFFICTKNESWAAAADWILDLLLYAHRWYLLHIQDCRLGLVNNKKQYDIVYHSHIIYNHIMLSFSKCPWSKEIILIYYSIYYVIYTVPATYWYKTARHKSFFL